MWWQRRRRLPGLSALVPGLGRRRRRRPARDREPARPPAWLGVDALWMSPIYPSPLADFGYDMADYTDVDPVFGSLRRLRRLVAAAHARGIRVLMDLVPSHTSIEHPWFREHPEWYIWSPVDGPPNNWVAAFGGPAWSRDPHGRGWYLHSFYPEQPDLNWRVPEVREAMAGVVRFWLDRGVDGFRVDAIDRLLKDSELRDDPPASAPFGLPLPEEYGTLEHLLLDERAGHPRGDRRAARRPPATRSWSARCTCRAPTRRRTWRTSTRCSRSSCSTRGRDVGAAGRGRRRSGAGARRRAGRGLGAVEPRLPAAARRGSGARTCASRRCCC